ncbi:unnamed protein product [marine sediment metagenome]|uniref:Uncharacterized protein n=1 Tax=marine sediment metagenome TaxID=412755 RepID=X0VSE4_9ZZZZ
MCDDYTIVQKYSRLYNYCHEFKFSVLNDKIICIDTTPARHKDPLITINYENEINPYLLQYVRYVIGIIKRKWPNYFYVRIDIMVDCIDPDAVLYRFPKIYLNEIEPLGSGLKAFCLNIEDNKIKRPTGTRMNLYGDESVQVLIADGLVKIIESKLIGGRKQKKYRLVKNIN